MEENCTCSFTICEIDSVPLLKMVIYIDKRKTQIQRKDWSTN